MRKLQLVISLVGATACGGIRTLPGGGPDGGGDHDSNPLGTDGPGTTHDGPPGGGSPDAPNTGPVCVGSNGFQVCLNTPPTTPLTLTGTIDTDLDPRCAANGGWGTGQPFSCIIAGTTIDLASGVTVTVAGGRPLVLVATADFTIGGTLDASSHVGPPATIGPASPSALCGLGTTPPSEGGGAGGSFMSKGGSGGSYSGGGQGNGGIAAVADTVAPSMLRPGCPGETGNGQLGGAQGPGGGAVFLDAGGTLTISGTVDASGGGGDGGHGAAGPGGGGGSGGMIALWGATINVSGMVVANGGGGGGGSDGGTSPGLPGSDPAAWNTPAPGGFSGATAPQIHGGSGSIDINGGNDGQNGGGGVGGTGGGGGRGYVQTNKLLTGAHVSPTPKLVP